MSNLQWPKESTAWRIFPILRVRLLVQINYFDVAYAMRSVLSVFMVTRVNWKTQRIDKSIFYVSMGLRMWFGATRIVPGSSSIHTLSIKYYCISGPLSMRELFYMYFFFSLRTDHEVNWFARTWKWKWYSRNVNAVQWSNGPYAVKWQFWFLTTFVYAD